MPHICPHILTASRKYAPDQWIRSPAANLKRCLLVSYVPLEGSDKQLVLVNLHLEAYDDGEGKAAQTEMLMDFLTGEYEKGNYIIAGEDVHEDLCLSSLALAVVVGLQMEVDQHQFLV